MKSYKRKKQKKLFLSKISNKQWDKIRQDLQFIESVTKTGKKLGLRVIIAGGYAVDGSLGKITRPHNDIDIQVYGNNPNGKQVIVKLIKKIANSNIVFSGIRIKKDHGRKTYYYGILAEKLGFGADFYYIQIKGNPFNETKVVIKDDGKKTNRHFFDTVKVKLEGIYFEAQNPKAELEDKVGKIKRGDKVRQEINQDIQNLQMLVNSKL